MKIRVSEEVLSDLRDRFSSSAPLEDGCFALLGEARSAQGSPDLILVNLIAPMDDEWEDRGADSIAPTSSYINRASIAADVRGLGLAFLHSHPDPGHPAGLSFIDRTSTHKLFRNLSSILPGKPLASIVFTPDSFAGTAVVEGEERQVSSMKVIGSRVQTMNASTTPGSFHPQLTAEILNSEAPYDRQVRAFGPEGQRRLSMINAAVVGAGGTGSAVAEQLIRMGIRRLTIVDDDLLDATNVSRVYGSTPNDASQRRSKVDVLREHLLRIAPAATVEGRKENVTGPGVADSLAMMDVIFCCTDTDGSRAVLNDISHRMYVPVIDLGCRINSRAGSVEGVYGRVRYLRPKQPCLWCTDSLDGRRILQESLSEEERKRLAEAGYGTYVTRQPSVIHLTSLVASIGVSEFLRLFVGAGPPHAGEEVYVDLSDNTMMRVSAKRKDDCRCIRIEGGRLHSFPPGSVDVSARPLSMGESEESGRNSAGGYPVDGRGFGPPATWVKVATRSYFLHMQDYWLVAKLGVSVREIRMKARYRRAKSNVKDRWQTRVIKAPGPGTPFDALKMGDAGARRKFDHVEVELEVETTEKEPYHASFRIGLNQSEWIQVDLLPGRLSL